MGNMVIRFFPQNRVEDTLQDRGIREWAVDASGNMCPKELGSAFPTPDAFIAGQMVLVGIGGLGPNVGASGNFQQVPESIEDLRANRGKLLYTFEQMTPDFIATLRFLDKSKQPYTIVTLDLGTTKTCWSRGVQKIYFI